MSNPNELPFSSNKNGTLVNSSTEFLHHHTKCGPGNCTCPVGLPAEDAGREAGMNDWRTRCLDSERERDELRALMDIASGEDTNGCCGSAECATHHVRRVWKENR